MEITEFTLLIARVSVIALMYLLLLVLVFALRADARAGSGGAISRPAAPRRSANPDSPTPQPVHSLLVVGGTQPATGREYPLFGPLEIGRSVSCNITIPNTFVSSHHARLFSQNERWMVEDLGSTNGTSLNGKLVKSAQPIHVGDKLLVGDTEFIVQ